MIEGDIGDIEPAIRQPILESIIPGRIRKWKHSTQIRILSKWNMKY